MSEIMSLEINLAKADLKKTPQTTTQDCKHAILQIAHKLELTLPPHSMGCLIISG